ncbi:MAG: hypothetical protein ACYTF6_11110 [Planctomycetota bacterium]|jgi:hypothetical protein
MDGEQQLIERLKDAIRKSLPRCPLVGPKWFCYEADSKRELLRFVALNKLVKATGMRPQALADRIVKNLDLSGLEAEVRVSPKYEIQLRVKQGQSGSKK